MIKRFYQLSILLICFSPLYLFFGCETVPVKQEPLPGSPVAQAPKLVVGDSWTYTGFSRKHLTGVYQVKVIKVKSNGSFEVERVDEKANKRWTNNYGSMSRIINAAARDFNFPLFVGKQWKAKYNERSIRGPYHNYKSTYLVKKYEKVETKAGNFNAFKINKATRNLETGWHGFSSYWYSPEVKIIVKERANWRSVRKLLSYKLAPDVIAKQSAEQKVIPQVNKSEQQKIVAGKDKPKTIITSEKKKISQPKKPEPPAQKSQPTTVSTTSPPVTSAPVIPDKKKYKIAVMKFQALNDASENSRLGTMVSEMFTTEVVNSDAFKIVEREQLRKIMDELNVGQSGIIDTTEAQKIGKMLGASAIITGSVMKMWDQLRIDSRIIEVETGIIAGAESRICQESLTDIGQKVIEMTNGLADKYYRNH